MATMHDPPNASRSWEHLTGLDGVRGLAVLMVLFFHANGQVVYQTNFANERTPLGRGLTWIANQGSHGVDLFFVLSGFLITGILRANLWQPVNRYFLHFYIRRSLRIFPLYFGVLIVAFGLLPWLGVRYTTSGMADAQRNQLWLWLYGTNFGMALQGLGFGRLSHFWTLAIEEHFYLLWPLAVWFFGRSRLAWVCGAIILGSFACRAGCFAFDNHHAAHLLTPCRIDALGMGGLLAWAVPSSGGKRAVSRSWWRTAGWSLLSAGTLFGVIALGADAEQGASFLQVVLLPSVTAIASAALIVLALPAQVPSDKNLFGFLMQDRLLSAMGKYSYAIYVFHVPLIPVLYAGVSRVMFRCGIVIETVPFPLLSIGFSLIAATVCFGVAKLSWVVFEQHFLKLKRFFG